MKLKKYLIKAASSISWIIVISAGLILSYAGCRIFVCDQFIIPSDSMNPTLIPGDRILADKLIFGARIYKSYDFSKGQPLESWRMPGLRRIRPNDVLVFNVPKGYGKGIEFKINYVFLKRCVGTPGDTVRIENGFYKNNNYNKLIGLESEQQRLRGTPDSLIPKGVKRMFPFDKRWTIKDFGPLYVPAKGDTLLLEPSVYRLYREVIQYETGRKLSLQDGICLLDGRPVSEYVFKGNYYFTGGDNVMDSGDSRYWGFVPEEFIIGVAKRISYSRDRNSEKLRWSRLWKKID